jgi:hypothetical protein
MLARKEGAEFRKFWSEWRKILELLVKEENGTLCCPIAEEVTLTSTAKSCIDIKLPYPIGVINIRQKRNESSKRLSIFFNGEISFGAPIVSAVQTNVAIFHTAEATDRASMKVLNLIDAYHFDFTSKALSTSQPHPNFHVQRNMRNDDYSMFETTLKKGQIRNVEIARLMPEEKHMLFQNTRFRVPIRQLDLFSLSAVISADYLVDGSTTKQKALFEKLLKLLRGFTALHTAESTGLGFCEPHSNSFVWHCY